jgi:hypothetical protein
MTSPNLLPVLGRIAEALETIATAAPDAELLTEPGELPALTPDALRTLRLGSVVIDRDGCAWQLRVDGWRCAGGTHRTRQWAELHRLFGPLGLALATEA